MRTRVSLLLALTLAACASPPPPENPAAETARAAAQMAVEHCSVCHGPAGNSTAPTFPRLAGQTEEYIESQLKAFKGHSRAEPDAPDFMWGVAAQLDEPMIAALAHYFAAQKPAPGTPGDATLMAKGKDLFDKGIPARGIPACATCHGTNAQGNGAFPRLAGQHAAYLAKQLEWIQSIARKAPVMHGIVQDMSKEEMEAVSIYLQSL